MIKQESIERVLAATDIIELVGRYVDLKPAGSNSKGCCPFHNEKTPSFNVSKTKQIYKCFGCGRSGNAITFLMEHRQLTFVEAVKQLAGDSGVVLEFDEQRTTPEQVDQETKARAVLSALKHAYMAQISQPVIAAYLQQRGLTADDLADWDIGLHPDEWQFAYNIAVDQEAVAVATELGLIRQKKETGNFYDTLHSRLIFPIHDHLGVLRGFAGRDVSGIIHPETAAKEPGKYVNPADSFFYKKERILYGLHRSWRSISQHGFAILVEGFMDVISMHRAGFDNTVAGCGTALTQEQVRLISRHTKTVVLFYDPDDAGVKAAQKNMLLLLDAGLVVKTYQSSCGDPDDWARSEQVLSSCDDFMMAANDALLHYCGVRWSDAGDDVGQRDDAVNDICSWLAHVSSDVARDEYTKKVAGITRIKKNLLEAQVKQWVEKLAEAKERQKRREFKLAEVPGQYKLPDDLLHKGLKWQEIKNDVEQYCLFMFDNRIWSQRGSDSFYFLEISNFIVRIIQHMEDEKTPMKLVQIQNIHGRKRTFDTRSEDFTTSIMGFKKVVSAFGNFNFEKAEPKDFSRLITKLMDDMGDGRMIHVLGWQDEGFFAFNNAVVFPDGKVQHLDEFGCFELDGASFYIPSGNKIHANNPNMMLAQKRVVLREASTPLSEFARQVVKVHREHGMNALLFTVATCFSDIIFDRLTFFPILFLHGEASSGKDNLIECCQSFFGKSQTALGITGKANTDKAKLRKFAQFKNMIVHLSEYKNGNEDTDVMLMGIWDRRGYERANLDSGVGTEGVPILSSMIFTSNDYPTYDPLITRIITEEMNKNTFTDAEKQNFELLKEMIHAGNSGNTVQILQLRSVFEQKFRGMYKDVAAEVKAKTADLGLADRMVQNAAVLGATLKLCDGVLDLGFSYDTWMAYTCRQLESQNNKRESSSVLTRFWDSILEAVKDGKTLVEHRDFSINGDQLVINMKAAYAAYNVKCYNVFRSTPHQKGVLIDKLKRDPAFIDAKVNHRYGDRQSSGFVFWMSKTGIKDELLDALLHINGKQAQAGTPQPAPMFGDVDEPPF